MKYSIVCRRCRKAYTPLHKVYTCECGSPLKIEMCLDGIEIDRKKLECRRLKRYPLVLRYFEFFPLLRKDTAVSIGEGYTPLVKGENIGKYIGLRKLYLKNDTLNPTGSFKDRPIVVGVNKAIEFGADTVATASSGNAANALAALSAKSKLRCVAFVPANAPQSKISQLLMYGAMVVPVLTPDGFIGDPTVKMLHTVYEELGWHPIPSFGHINPYQLEGAKSMAFEIAEDIQPEHVVVPVGSGGLLAGNFKGFKEFHTLGIIDDMPVLYGVQSKGCAPLVKGFNTGVIETWKNPKTVAGGLMDPYPWDADDAIMGLKSTRGMAIAVSDDAILDMWRLLAVEEGIFAEPTGVVSLAGVRELVDRGVIKSSECVVCEITGAGFKDLTLVERTYATPQSIKPDIDALIQLLKTRYGFRIVNG